MDAVESALSLRYGLTGSLEPLAAEHARVFRLTGPEGDRRLVKLFDDPAAVELQEAALLHVESAAPAVAVSRLLRTTDGATSCAVATPGGPRVMQVMSWIEGRTWADVGGHGPSRLRALGRAVAELDRALAGFEHPAARRTLAWNLADAATVAPDAAALPADRRAVAERIFERFKASVAPRLASLPHQVIHNDANDRNVILDADGDVAGLIDFGDVVWSARVCGLAVACAYAMQGQADPLAAAARLVAGYDEVVPLEPAELAVLFDLVLTRLAVSACMAVRQHAVAPDNDYLLVSQDAVWTLLDRIADASAELAHFRFRDACGWAPNPATRAVRQLFESGRLRPRPVLDPDPRTAAAVTLDWRSTGWDLRDPADREAATNAIATTLGAACAEVAIGPYGERRDVYVTPAFERPDGPPRCVHLGVDFFCDAGSPVFAPLDATVAGVADNTGDLDYGGVILLEHAPPGGPRFWTLYGHLDRDSVARHCVGDRVAAGSEIGTLGDVAENGGWPPHLHLQLLTSLVDAGTDVPGVAPADETTLWQSISPDPNLLVRRESGLATRAEPSAAAILARRRANLSATLSVAYDEPLHIVRGRGARLIDAGGRAWLDMVNNVAHVGHSHPRVVAAAQRQSAELNTNTRYLHGSIADYAERLVATLPEPLRVVFLVNSGSEANDLALRLATAHTGREDVLVLDQAYHGNLSSLVAISPYKFDGPGGRGGPATTWVCELPDVYRGTDRDDPDLGARYARGVERVLGDLADRGRGPAAFFAESLPGVAGQIVLPDGYLEHAYRAVRAAGGVCVADEVQVGFGRVGETFWAFELQGVVPDVVTLGKPIGNGHPLGAVVTTPAIASSFATGMEYFNTFGGNPVSCEVGLAVLDVVRDEGLQARAANLGERLRAGLDALAARHPLIGDVRGRGLFLGVELSLDGRAPAVAEARRVKEAVKSHGVLVSLDGPDENVVKLKPPLALGADDCDEFLEAFDAALGLVEER